MRVCACGCGLLARARGKYATDACRARAWKVATNYRHAENAPQRARNGTRNANVRKARPSDLRITWTQLVDRLGRDVAESVLTDAQHDRLERLRG